MAVCRPTTEDEFSCYYELRWQVLREPWGQPRGSERDDLEEQSVHAVVWAPTGEPLAVGRLHFNSPEEAQIRYMAVVETARGRGLGGQVLDFLEAIARQRGARTIVLNARNDAAVFYERHQYEPAGSGPTLFGTVVHTRMTKRL
jgi:GNAT superfamily N-acetyltransferase